MADVPSTALGHAYRRHVGHVLVRENRATQGRNKRPRGGPGGPAGEIGGLTVIPTVRGRRATRTRSSPRLHPRCCVIDPFTTRLLWEARHRASGGTPQRRACGESPAPVGRCRVLDPGWVTARRYRHRYRRTVPAKAQNHCSRQRPLVPQVDSPPFSSDSVKAPSRRSTR